MSNKKPWDLTEEDYVHICDPCKLDPDITSSDIGEGCEYYHDCLVECGQKKLLSHLKFISIEDYEVSRFHNIGLAISHTDLEELEKELE